MVVAIFFPDISQFSIDSPLSEAYPPSKHGCPLPSTCWVVRLQASTLFPEEVCLLGQHHLLVVTSSRPRPNNLFPFTNTCLSSGSLASSGAAHNPIPLSKPFIPTIYIYIYIYYRICFGIFENLECDSYNYTILGKTKRELNK